MQTFEIDPEDIISDFLRVHMVDPRNRAEAVDSETIISGTSQTIFSLSSPPEGSISCLTSVTVDGVVKKKWKEFFWDYQNNIVTFYDPVDDSVNVVFTFKYGTKNWIYGDKIDEQLKDNGFPRICIFSVSGSGKRLGQYESPVESSPILQIDSWCKNGKSYTINGKTYSNEYLGRYISRKIVHAFEDYEEDLFPVLYNYIPTGIPREAPYSPEFQAHHTITEINLKGLRLGRIVVPD